MLQILSSLADGTIDLIVGTHSLISDTVEFQNLGLAVVDEQHRCELPHSAITYVHRDIARLYLRLTAPAFVKPGLYRSIAQ